MLSMGDTIKSRLAEARADLSRIIVIDDSEEALTLSDDRIEKAVRQNPVRIVIIDPVQAFIGHRMKNELEYQINEKQENCIRLKD